MKTTIEISDDLFRVAKIRAVETRRSLRDIVEAALQAYLAPAIAPPDQGKDARIEAILAALDALPVRDARSADELLGYNEEGTFE